MIIKIKEQFCREYNSEDYNNTINIYSGLGILYGIGYCNKICVKEQEISLDNIDYSIVIKCFPRVNCRWVNYINYDEEMILEITV